MSVRLQAIVTVVVLAAVVLVVYRNHHRSPANDTGGEPIGVLVAKTTIPKGTSGGAIGQGRLYKLAEIPQAQLRNGAIFDPSALAGKFAPLASYVTLRNIARGAPLTSANFGPATP
jgi:flagella basal body P-ring formation protein FlgA